MAPFVPQKTRLKIVSLLGSLAALCLLAQPPALGALAAAQDPAPAGQEPAPADRPGIAIPADGAAPVQSPSGLVTSVLRKGDGSGRRPKRGDLVKVRYSGFLTDGTLFDSAVEEPVEFRVGQVVPGWNEALESMEIGQRNKLTLPPELGYGKRGAGDQIPPDSTLIFDVELVGFSAGPVLPAFEPLPAELPKSESGLRVREARAGSGQSPASDEPYKLLFTFYNLAGQPIDSSEWGNGPLIADLQRVQFPFLKELHPRLSQGAVLWVEVPGAQGFGDIDIPGVGAGEPTVWRIEVLAVLRAPELPAFQPLDSERLTSTASGLKYQVLRAGEGNPCGQEGTFKLNYTIYSRAGKVIDSSLKRGGSALLGTVAQMRLPMLQELPPLMAPGAIYLLEQPVADVFGQRVPPGLEGEATCCWRLEMSAVLVPLPVPEFKRTAEGQGERTESGLLIEWLRRGEGPTLRRDQRAIVHYAGWLEDGTLFDSSFQRGDVSNFRLDQVVPGWTEGLQRMNVGSIARLTLPWQLAYGEAGKGEIPPRANLIFYVEVLGIEE